MTSTSENVFRHRDHDHDACVADATWSALASQFDTTQIIDLLFTVGQYNLVSMTLNTLGVQLEQGARGFPSQ